MRAAAAALGLLALFGSSPAGRMGGEKGSSEPLLASISVFRCSRVVLVDAVGRVDSSTHLRPSAPVPGVQRVSVEAEESSGAYQGPVGWAFGLGERTEARFLLWLKVERDSSMIDLQIERGRCEKFFFHRAPRRGWYRYLITLSPISDEDSCAVAADWSGPSERPASWGRAEPLDR